MRRPGVLIALVIALLSATAAAALAKGDPQGPVKKQWLCVLDLGTWHCVAPGVLANFGGPGGPSLNWECTDPDDYEQGGTCGKPYADEGRPPSFGPLEGTVFAGTEQLIRADVYGGQPCTQGSSGFVDLPVDEDGDTIPDKFVRYWFCHHYQHLDGHP